jgi:trk system potassium uptake protein
MKIIIAGAGDIGFHLAKLLSSEQQDIVLIDSNSDVLNAAGQRLDVLAIRGDASSPEILKSIGVQNADLFLAMTTSESTNIISSILAKRLGAKQTIARVNKVEYIQEDYKVIFSELGVDRIISPIYLAANEIERLLELTSVTDSFDFENGKISLIGVTLTAESVFIGRSLRELQELYPKMESRPIAILRGSETILPRSNTMLRHNDHIYFITLKKDVEKLVSVMGRKSKAIKNIMLVGGSDFARIIAKQLEENYRVTIVEPDRSRCKLLTESLNNSLIIHADPSNLDILKEEGLSEMDAFIALNPNSEINIITSLMAEQQGVYKTIALVDNADYTRISQNIGVDTLINKKIIAANYIFRFVRKGKVEAITSLHGVDAEVIEYVIQKGSKLTRKSLRDIKFPENTLIGGVIRGEQSIIPTGDFQLKEEDKVIVFSVSDSISKLENLFR